MQRFRKLFLFLLCFICLGCAATQLFGPNYIEVRNQFKEKNREQLAHLRVGMSQQEVLDLMGDDSIKSKGVIISNPFHSETLKGKDYPLFVLYYYAYDKEEEDEEWQSVFEKFEVRDRELYPVVFHDDVLIGWGENFLNENLSVYEREMRRLGIKWKK